MHSKFARLTDSDGKKTTCSLLPLLFVYYESCVLVDFERVFEEVKILISGMLIMSFFETLNEHIKNRLCLLM